MTVINAVCGMVEAALGATFVVELVEGTGGTFTAPLAGAMFFFAFVNALRIVRDEKEGR